MANSNDETSSPSGGDQSGVTTPVIGIAKRKRRGLFGGAKSGKDAGAENRYGVESPSGANDPADFDKVESAKFIGQAVVGLVQLVESMAANSCENKLRRKRPDKVAEFLETAKRVGLQPQEQQLIQNSSERIAMKYELLTRFGPEVVLSVTLGQFGLRQLAMMRTVEQLTAEKKPAAPAAQPEEKK